ncbi:MULTISPECIES: ABC transporter substrate-binding protein [unclassified Leucobacter]|uniref:ABC transporter substrate-binding protein n=1 Tax=unclassified Leucobacter TaxID=2621730 RepID=UPI00165D9A8D|nr:MULTISPECIES: ABC transporter substrate-binding protein [unclassified Leucobacter]MBC9936424.1 ABC transporter substrate-binding protein [Leucobacter sp. cx-87]
MRISSSTKKVLASSLMIPMLLIAGCSAAPVQNQPVELDLERGLASTPAGVGAVDVVRWNLTWGEPSSLDWIYAYADSENTTLANMCEGLMRQNEDMTLSPALAETVTHVDDLTTVFEIRKGVQFWDGSPLTAEDVAFSLNRHMDPDSGSYWGDPFYDNVGAIEVTGEHEVTVRFTQPDSLFERMLATAAGIVGSKSFVENAGEAYGTASGGIMCTGPFSLKSWQSGSKIVLDANPSYWDQGLVPLAKQLELTFVTDESTVANSLLSGDLDGTYMPPLSATEKLATSDTGTFALGLGTDWVAIRPTEKEGLMHQLEMRQALSLILDRDAVAQAVFRGTAQASLTPIQPGAWGYAKDVWQAAADELPAPEFDVEQAQKIVQEAGLEGSSVKIAIPSDSEAEKKIAEILTAGAGQIGIEVAVEVIPITSFTELYFDAKAREAYDAFIVWEYGAGVADPVVSMSEFTPLSAYNYGNYDDQVLTQSVADALTTLDPDARAEILVKGQARMVEDLPLINVVTLENRVYQNDRITGATASRASLYFPWAANIGSPE